MFDRKELKRRAKLVLLRSYSKVFLACFIVSMLSGGGIGMISGRYQSVDFYDLSQDKLFMVSIIIIALMIISVLLSIFVVSPLLVGQKKFMIENSKADASLNLLLVPFNNDYKRIVFIQFMKDLFIFLWTIPALLPLGVLLFNYETTIGMIISASYGSAAAERALLGVMFLWGLSTLILSVPALIKELQYMLVPYLLADDPTLTWRDALSKSKEMMVGNKWAYLKLLITFIPWILAANLLCCVGGFLLTPYIEATVCEMYMELSGQTPADNVFYEM